MRITKKISALLLTCALLAGLCVTGAAAGEDVSTFTDITDPAVGQAVESLREMGVVTGVGEGNFNPGGTLTRAQFCVMAIQIMGHGGDVAAQSHRVIFSDVTARHWALGYVNLAVTIEIDGGKLIAGTGSGIFSPDRVITYAEASTILLRILGYGSEASDNWPHAVMGLAESVGLNAGIGSVTENSGITRAQAAILFRNMLLAHPKGSSAPWVNGGGDAGYTAHENAILLSVDAKTADGSLGVLTSAGDAAKPAVSGPAPFFLGKKGTAVYDAKGLFLTFLPDPGATTLNLTVELATETSIRATNGTTVTVDPSVTVYRNEVENLVYGNTYNGFRPGLNITIFYDGSGKMQYIYVPDVQEVTGGVMVAASDGIKAFDAITGGSENVIVVRNGISASSTDIKTSDVGVYNPAVGTLYVTNFRISAILEKVEPNIYAPKTVTLLGKKFDVLETAYTGLSDIKLGASVTALFTPDGKIAKLVPLGTVGSNALGVVTNCGDGRVNIELINAPFKFEVDFSEIPINGSTLASNYVGYVVSISGVNADGAERLALSRQSGSAIGPVDVKARTVGGTPLSNGARVYERVGKGPLNPIALSELTLSTIPASKVTYAHRDASGNIDVLILDDVTGDCYTYGFTELSTEVTQRNTPFGDIENTVTIVTFGGTDGKSETLTVVGGYTFENGVGGVAESLNVSSDDGDKGAAGFMPLSELTELTQLNFSVSARTCTVGGVTIPIASNVQCYDKATGSWFSSLAQCLIHTNSFTAYFDRSPSEGGKIRLIIAG